MATFEQKLSISMFSSVLFYFVNYPFSPGVVCPKNKQLITNMVTFFMLSFLTMSGSNVKIGTKIKHSLYSSLIFYFVSSPALYSLVGSVLGSSFSDQNGCGTLYGLILHTVVYCCILVAVMYLP
jgi:hypothetical protein